MNQGTTIKKLPESTSVALDLLREQARLYAELESCARRQHEMVTDEQVGPLLSVLSDRQHLSASLATLGRRLAPVRAVWESYRAEFSTEQRTEAEQLLKEAAARLQSVMKGDEQDVRVLYGRKQAVANALRSTHNTNQAMTAYGGSATTTRGRVNEES